MSKPLRIFIAVRHASNPARFYGGLWSGNFYPALRQMGHDLVESQTDLAPTSELMTRADALLPADIELRARTTQSILDELKAARAQKPVDLFLSYFYNCHFDPSAFSQIRAMGIRSVNFYCNSIYQFELVDQIAAKADYSWHAEKHARQSYLNVGAHPVWVQMAADPDVYRPIDGLPRQAKACFVGQRYADRDRWLAAMIRAKVPLEIYGPGWGEDPAPAPSVPAASLSTSAVSKPAAARIPSPGAAIFNEVKRNLSKFGLIGGLRRSKRQYDYRKKSREIFPLFKPFARGPIPFTQICQAFGSFEVILNFSNVWADARPGSELIGHVRLRDFEAPMCRTCYLTGYTDEITEFYEPGKEIDIYRTPDELIEKSRFYLNNPDAAERLRRAGYERARRDHTWVRRFEQLFREIGMQS